MAAPFGGRSFAAVAGAAGASARRACLLVLSGARSRPLGSRSGCLAPPLPPSSSRRPPPSTSDLFPLCGCASVLGRGFVAAVGYCWYAGELRLLAGLGVGSAVSASSRFSSLPLRSEGSAWGCLAPMLRSWRGVWASPWLRLLLTDIVVLLLRWARALPWGGDSIVGWAGGVPVFGCHCRAAKASRSVRGEVPHLRTPLDYGAFCRARKVSRSAHGEVLHFRMAAMSNLRRRESVGFPACGEE